MTRTKALVIGSVIALVLFGAPVVEAQGGCSQEGSTLVITATESNIDVLIGRSSGGAITVGETPCGSASVSNVDLIQFKDGTGGSAKPVIDLSNGGLVPGATAETGGTSEIEIELELVPFESDYDALQIEGGPTSETITVGAAGIGLNNDADADITVTSGLEDLRIRIEGNDGDDIMKATGGSGTGAPFAQTVDLFGMAGDDVLVSGEAGDRLEGGAGADSMDGGSDAVDYTGYDIVGYTDSPGPVSVDLSTGIGSGSDATGDTFTGMDTIYGSDFDDTLTGDDGINGLLGDEGNDTMVGKGGVDYLEGGPGADAMRGDDGFDSINYYGSEAAVQIDLGAGTASGGEAAGDEIATVEEVAGSNFDDHLIGSEGADELEGHGGNDLLEGLGGNDSLSGKLGDDLERGGPGNDLFGQDEFDGADILDGAEGKDGADYYGRAGTVFMSSDGVANDGEEGEGDNLTGIEELGASDGNDVILGSSGKDKMNGRGGDDELSGSAGDDRLVGGPGHDNLKGGPGNDTCLVSKQRGVDKTSGCEVVIKRNNM